MAGQSSCKKDPNEKFVAAVRSYTQKKHQDLGTALLESVSINNFETGKPLAIHGSLYRQEKNRLKVIYPRELSITLKNDMQVKYCVAGSTHLFVSDQLRLQVYDLQGELKNEIMAGEKGKPVQDFILVNNNLYFITEFQLYIYDPASNGKKLLTEEKFLPVNSKHYRVWLFPDGDNLGILSGLAGSYNFDVVNTAMKTHVLKKFPLSSSKLKLMKGELYHIRGGAGEWTLEKYQITGKATQVIQKFGAITDLEISSRGYLIQDVKGISVAGYGGETVRIPFQFQLRGTYGDLILIAFQDRIYLVDFDNLYDRMKTLKRDLPDIFN